MKSVLKFIVATIFALQSLNSAIAQPSVYIGFDGWLPWVNTTQTAVFSAGDTLTSKTNIELANNTNATLIGWVETTIDGAEKQTIGPIIMPSLSTTYINATRTKPNATAVNHTIKATVTIKDSLGNIVGDGENEHIYTPSGGGPPQ